jgi:hypothetical protein
MVRFTAISLDGNLGAINVFVNFSLQFVMIMLRLIYKKRGTPFSPIALNRFPLYPFSGLWIEFS